MVNLVALNIRNSASDALIDASFLGIAWEDFGFFNFPSSGNRELGFGTASASWEIGVLEHNESLGEFW